MIDMPRTATAAVLHGALDIRVETVPLRELGEHDLLVEMRSGGICGSDMHYYSDGRNGSNVLTRPTALGHEGAGVVVAVGDHATVAVGTSVVIEPAIPCGVCPSCRGGRYNVCTSSYCFGSPPTGGLFATRVVVPESAAHQLPNSISPLIGALIEPLAVAVWAVERAQLHSGHRLLITGAGPIGLLVAQVALQRGAAEVIVTDVNDDRLAAATRLGVSRVINPGKEGLSLTGLDRLIECSGSPAALISGIMTLRPAARATVVGQAAPAVDGIPLAFLQRWEIDLVAAFRYANAFPAAIALVDEGKVDLEAMVTARYPLTDIARALVAPTADPSNLKVLVQF
jgi:L-iditol 2-dehydrogenase